jgi:Flp pilus assembly protein TadD
VQRAAELNPDSARAQMTLARALLDEGKKKEALAAANRAVDLAPWNPYTIETLAVVAAGFGKCPEALQLQRRAERIFVQNDKDLDGARKRTVALEERCAPREPAR